MKFDPEDDLIRIVAAQVRDQFCDEDPATLLDVPDDALVHLFRQGFEAGFTCGLTAESRKWGGAGSRQ